MDITQTIEPKSDQQNFDDYIAGPRTVTITEVKVVGGEQPVELHLAEYPGRPFKPGKSMRRVLIQAWGTKAGEWAGRQLRLYGDPEVKFGGQKVGGIRISHLSHIDAPVEVSLTVTRGKRAPFIVQPLTNTPNPAVDEVVADLMSASSLEVLAAVWEVAKLRGVAKDPGVVAAKDKRKAELAAD